MENISRVPTFGDVVTNRTEASMQDITVAIERLQSTNSTDSPLPPLLNVMYCVRASKYSLRNTKEKGVVGNLSIFLVITIQNRFRNITRELWVTEKSHCDQKCKPLIVGTYGICYKCSEHFMYHNCKGPFWKTVFHYIQFNGLHLFHLSITRWF